jgi:hypothetical protein
MPKVVFNQEKIESQFKIVPEGLYQVKVLGFKPAKSKGGDSINFNPILELVGTTDGSPCPKQEDGSPITSQYWAGLNSKADGIVNDFCHCFGLPMEGPPTALEIPGIFDGPEGEPSRWQYKGPLVGRIGKAYLIQQEYNTRQSNKIKYYVCAVPDCPTRFPKVRHSTDLTKQKS